MASVHALELERIESAEFEIDHLRDALCQLRCIRPAQIAALIVGLLLRRQVKLRGTQAQNVLPLSKMDKLARSRAHTPSTSSSSGPSRPVRGG